VWHSFHPFLEHYQTASCEPAGDTGDWWAASGASDGAEQWSVDLSAYAGSDVEVSISYASDDSVQQAGVFVDDVVVSNGPGTTSFEADGDDLDGWTVAGPPAGSAPNANDWIAGSLADLPPTIGQIAEGSLAREGEIIDFLAETFGPYPFVSAGGIVDDEPILFALENQTRPIYSFLFFFEPLGGDRVVAHELAHQWFGDHLSLDTWQHIWLNEGLATYAEWLWSEREGPATVQQIFDFAYAVVPPDSPFWSLPIGDPGPDHLFDKPVYDRGAMTVHQLRLAVGDATFQQILHSWVEANAGGSVTTDGFIDLAEDISGQDLDPLFETWLFTPGKPDLGAANGPAVALRAPSAGKSSRVPYRR
jgi:hypothetical protein